MSRSPRPTRQAATTGRVRAPRPRPPPGAALPPALRSRGRRRPPPAVPEAGAGARHSRLALTVRGRERRTGRHGGVGTTARAPGSKAPPPPQLLRCRRAARQETGGFGAGRPPHVPASGPAMLGDRPLKGQAPATSGPARSGKPAGPASSGFRGFLPRSRSAARWLLRSWRLSGIRSLALLFLTFSTLPPKLVSSCLALPPKHHPG